MNNKLILKVFFFFLPLSGFVNTFFNIKITIFLSLAIFLIGIFSHKTFKLNFLVFISLILLSIFHLLDSLEFGTVSSISLSFLFYCFTMVGIGFYSIDELIESFATGYTGGIVFLGSLFLLFSFLPDTDRVMMLWQKGLPVNLSGYGNPNGAAPFYIFGFLSNFILYRVKESYNFRNLMVVNCLICLPLFFTFSRSGYLALAIFIFCIGSLNQKIIFTLVMTVLLSSYTFFSQELIDSSVRDSVLSNKLGSNEVRWLMYLSLFEILNSIKLLGIGVGEAKSLILQLIGWPISLHNVYLAILIELGILPFTVLMFLVFLPFLYLLKSREWCNKTNGIGQAFFATILSIYGIWLFHESHINSTFWIIYVLFLRLLDSDVCLGPSGKGNQKYGR